MSKEIAILMAAGLGTRMRPLTEKIPKPLVKVHGTPMIETIIYALEKRGIDAIYIIVGYKKEQFQYLLDKYRNVQIIENTEFSYKNNISSIFAARFVLGKENCFICEADLYVSDSSIFEKNHETSSYYGKMVKGVSEDWVFDVDTEGRITRVGKGGRDTYNMVGISYLLKEDAREIGRAVCDAYKNKGHEDLFWDEIVNQKLDTLNFTITPVCRNQIVEIDTLEELKIIDDAYRSVI